MNCTPFLDIARRSFSPARSTEMTSLRSITHVQTLRLRYAFFQFVLSSLTHGSTKRPCRTHRISAGVWVMVIFNTFPLLFPHSDATACRNRKRGGQRCFCRTATVRWLRFAGSFLAHESISCALAHVDFGTAELKGDFVHLDVAFTLVLQNDKRLTVLGIATGVPKLGAFPKRGTYWFMCGLQRTRVSSHHSASVPVPAKW